MYSNYIIIDKQFLAHYVPLNVFLLGSVLVNFCGYLKFSFSWLFKNDSLGLFPVWQRTSLDDWE